MIYLSLFHFFFLALLISSTIPCKVSMSLRYLLSFFISAIISSTFLQNSGVKLSSSLSPNSSSSSLIRSFISLRSLAHYGSTNLGSFFFFFFGRRLTASVGFFVSGSRGFFVL